MGSGLLIVGEGEVSVRDGAGEQLLKLLKYAVFGTLPVVLQLQDERKSGCEVVRVHQDQSVAVHQTDILVASIRELRILIQQHPGFLDDLIVNYSRYPEDQS